MLLSADEDISVLALSITRLAQTPSVFTKVGATWELSKLSVCLYSYVSLYHYDIATWLNTYQNT